MTAELAANPQTRTLPTAAELEPRLFQALEAARRAGASAAEVHVSSGRGLSVGVRMGEVESLEFQRDRELSLTVFFGQRSGSASCAELSDSSLMKTVEAACTIAKVTGEDPCSGLADAALMAKSFPDLDLCHPWAITPEEAIEMARTCEQAAFAVDPRIEQSEGASLNTRHSLSLYANSLGFVGSRESTDHSLSCVAIAGRGEDMQNGHWYATARAAGDLESAGAVGRRAGERAVARLDPRPLTTRTAPVLFPPELSRGLFGSFIGAISGGALYRRSSFLLDALGTQVFAANINARQMPYIRRGAASSAFDNEGVATVERSLIEKGVLMGWVLGSYSARKLGLVTTGNAGGVYNLVVEPTYAGGLQALTREMGEGLIVTDLMGQGVNPVTGDYSRGASGFWVENGIIAYPVQEITIASNLREMYKDIRAIGNDVDIRGGVRCGSVLIEKMTIAA